MVGGVTDRAAVDLRVSAAVAVAVSESAGSRAARDACEVVGTDPGAGPTTAYNLLVKAKTNFHHLKSGPHLTKFFSM